MRKHEQIGLDFKVDKLTDSIENVVSGDSFATDITIISISDLKEIRSPRDFRIAQYINGK